MAIVQYSALINEIKGKLGGSIFQGGTAGSVVRSIDGIRDSAKLTKADAGRVFIPRRRLAATAGQWRLLTDAQRAAWTAAAVNFPFKNKFGQLYTASGFQVFVHLNTQVSNITGVYLSDPPVPISVPDLDTATFDIPDDENMNIDYAGGVPSGFVLRVEATQMMAAGKQPKNGFFKIIAQIPNGVVFPQNLADGYEEVYGDYHDGCVIWFRLSLVSNTTGQKGVSQVYAVTLAF